MLVQVKDNIIRFLFGGNAYFTLVQGTKHHSYNIVRKKTNDGSKVYKLLLTDTAKTYCGYFKIIGNTLKYKHNPKFGVSESDECIKLILKTIRFRKEDTDTIRIYHVGRCGHCGRTLTDPDSIARGFGPDCWKLLKSK